MDLFAQQLLAWFAQHGRKQLPWQNPRSAYFVWVSEIMLQQTQVTTVINYFNQFITRFPDIKSLAQASLDEVLRYWAGLGYYSRAKNLHRCAQIIHHTYNDVFPNEVEVLQTLPGIGASTAGAIIAQAFNQFAVILDGNVKRVLSRYHAVSGNLNQSVTVKKLWHYATEHTPQKHIADYTQAIMDLGALICTRSKPKCTVCPLADCCVAWQTNRILDFPEKKPTRILPKRKQFFLLLLNQNQEILMAQQPESGIWSNLWSLPSADTKKTLMNNYPQLIASKKTLPTIEHRFTHFHLTLYPIFIILQNNTTPLTQSNQRWVKTDQLNTLALPAPIKKLLATIFDFSF
jgi:A/G-specific adenine glycosylase